MKNLFLLCLLVLLYSWSVFGQCPVDVSGYTKWSEEYPQVSANDKLTISKPILLDVAELEVYSITLVEPNGILFFSNDIDISLRVRYILVNDQGSLIIGTEECKHTAKVTITLIGTNGDYEIPPFNSKFIGVEPGGTIEIHGPYKLPWTKLTKSVHKVDKDHGAIYEHLLEPDIDVNTKGVVMYAFDRTTGLVEGSITVKLFHNSQNTVNENIQKLETFLAGVADGKVVALAIQKNIIKMDLTNFYDLVETLTGSSLIRSLEENGAYAAVTVKGDTSQTRDAISQDPDEKHRTAMAELIALDVSRKFRVISFIHTVNNARSWVNFISSNTDYSLPILNLNNDASTWKVGDQVILTSTDYNWEQAEQCELMSCDQCSANQVRLACEPKYTHFADLCKGIDMLDMRGEVGLLTRNIKIMGETTEEEKFGGHIMMLKGFKNAHFEGIELYHMGQNFLKGHYPIHFHMCEDVGPDTYSNPAYSRGNSIHHTFARGTTIHGTLGLHVHHNFIFDTLGHGIFFEDGGEQFNVIEWNLVGGQRKTGLVASDDRPTSFWVTNPKNYFRNNIACGSDSVGFWFAFPELPVALSRDRNFMQEGEARHTALYEFDNNVAHSNVKAGLFFDNKLQDDHDLAGYNQYNPLEDPFNKSSPPKEVFLRKFTGFKNEVQNSWVRGGLITMEYCTLADSGIGNTFVRDNHNRQLLRKCLVVGDSCNLGEPEDGEPRSQPVSANNPRLGVVFGKGPSHIVDCWFDNFTKTNSHGAGAFSPDKKNTFRHTTPVHSVSGILFGFDDSDTTGNRCWDEEPELSFDNDYIASFRDLDGSVTKKKLSQVVPLHDYLLTQDCRVRESWDFASCPRLYGSLHVRRYPKDQEVEPDMIIARDDDPQLVDYSIEGNTTTKFMVILGGKFSYIMAYTTEIPTAVQIEGIGVEKSRWVRIGLCIPRDATFDLKGENFKDKLKTLADWTEVNSVEEVDSDGTAASYYFDKDVGVLFLKMMSINSRGENDYEDCPSDMCPLVRVTILDGDRSDSNCLSRAYDKYKRISEVGPPKSYGTNIKASSILPPADWGAGLFPPLPGF